MFCFCLSVNLYFCLSYMGVIKYAMNRLKSIENAIKIYTQVEGGGGVRR